MRAQTVLLTATLVVLFCLSGAATTAQQPQPQPPEQQPRPGHPPGDPLDDAMIAVDHSADAPFAYVAAWAAAVGERSLADERRIGRVKVLDEVQRELSLRSESAATRLSVEEFLE